MVLDDLLEPDLLVVFCGSAVGSQSAKKQAYYAGQGNKFWPILHRVGLTDTQLPPQDYQSLLRYQIGLTDLNKSEFGADRDLTRTAYSPHDLDEKIRRYEPRFLAFNGKAPAKAFYAYFGWELKGYGRQTDVIGKTAIFVLPSTSGSACKYWDEKHWRALAIQACGNLNSAP